MKTRYVALLRGINIGAANRIRMDALRRLFEGAGFSGVETYIQSGNVLFDASEAEDEARRKIEYALTDGADIHTTAVLRTAQELNAIVSGSPFSADEIERAQRANTDGESFYVCLLPEPVSNAALAALAAVPPEGDRFEIVGRDIYLLLVRSIRLSKLAIRLQKLLPGVTVRNWNTISKLSELANTSMGGDDESTL